MAAFQSIHLPTSLSMVTIIFILRFLVCLPRIPQRFPHRLNSAPTTSIGTRRCTSIKDVNQDSPWINGYCWMKESEEHFPCKTVDEIKLNSSETEQLRKEMVPQSEFNHASIRDALTERYRHSNYLIDPNCHRFQRVIRTLAIAHKFICVLRKRVSIPVEQRASSSWKSCDYAGICTR